MEMTIFFSKHTGWIQAVFQDNITFENSFMERAEDMKSFCIRVVTDFNLEVLAHMHKYKIDLETKEIVLKDNFINKPVQLNF